MAALLSTYIPGFYRDRIRTARRCQRSISALTCTIQSVWRWAISSAGTAIVAPEEAVDVAGYAGWLLFFIERAVDIEGALSAVANEKVNLESRGEWTAERQAGASNLSEALISRLFSIISVEVPVKTSAKARVYKTTHNSFL